jgi:hypothetical protein
LNEDLKQDTPGVGYLAGDSPGIPKMTDGDISEELLYPCRFWMDHIVEVEAPVPNLLIEALHSFLSTQLISWIEILTAKDKFQKLLELRKWIQVGILARIETCGI